MSRKLPTFFYFEGKQWKIDIPGHLIVNCNSYVHALNKWKLMRQNVDETGVYSTPMPQSNTSANTGDLTSGET